MKILMPVDGSVYTKRMLAYVAAHDELLGAEHEYVVLTVVPQVPPRVAAFVERSAIEDFHREEAEEVLRPVRAFIEQTRWNARFVHRHGPVVDAIAAVAEAEKPGLIVMGTHGHSSLGNVVLGSVATGVIARCRRPVLLVP